MAVAVVVAPAGTVIVGPRRSVRQLLAAMPPLVMEACPCRLTADRLKTAEVGACVALSLDVVFVLGRATPP